MPKQITPFEMRSAMRSVSRAHGLDPGDGPGLEDVERDLAPAESPTLAAMTTDQGQTPRIGDVGEPPTGRARSEPGSADVADRLSRGKADFALAAERRDPHPRRG